MLARNEYEYTAPDQPGAALEVSVKDDRQYRAVSVRRTVTVLVIVAAAFYFGIIFVLALK